MYDLYSLIKDHRIDHRTRGKGIGQGWIGVNCPHKHGIYTDRDYFLGIEITTGRCSCWSCGALNPVDTVASLLSISMHDAIHLLKDYTKDKVYVDTLDTIHAREVILPLRLPFTPIEKEYLESRGITDSMVMQYDIRSGGIVDDFFKYRIILPIYKHGKLVSATGRTVINNAIRYKTLPPEKEVIHHKKTLYAQDYATGSSCAVVEGPIDAIKGGSGFVATYGSNITDAQVSLLTKYDKIYILGDKDFAGRKASQSLGNRLSLICNAEVYSVEYDATGKDVGSLPMEAIMELRQELFND